MIEIVIPYTYQNINQKIHYKTDTGFDKTISELEDIFNEANDGGIITDLDEIIWLFKQFKWKYIPFMACNAQKSK